MRNIDIQKLVRLNLPTFMRKPIRIAWLMSRLTTFTSSWAAYTEWRTTAYREAVVTPQTISIEMYLNDLFDEVSRRIKLVHGEDRTVYVTRIGEQNNSPLMPGQFVYRNGEQSSELIDGFIVRIPKALESYAMQIEGIVNRVRAAGVTFTVEIV